jgi:hypothetical protein
MPFNTRWAEVSKFFRTEFIKIKPLKTNTTQKITNIATFDDTGSSTSLYVESLRIVESIMAIVVNINMRISEIFLPRLLEKIQLSFVVWEFGKHELRAKIVNIDCRKQFQ